MKQNFSCGFNNEVSLQSISNKSIPSVSISRLRKFLESPLQSTASYLLGIPEDEEEIEEKTEKNDRKKKGNKTRRPPPKKKKNESKLKKKGKFGPELVKAAAVERRIEFIKARRKKMRMIILKMFQYQKV